jgi:signal transduction histidine kinase
MTIETEAGSSFKARPARPVLSLHARLTLLVVVLVASAAIATLLLVMDAARGHRATTERQLAGTARALSLATDGEVGKLEAVLRVLAASPSLQSGDLAAFERQARAVDLGPHAWFVLLDDTGQQLINTYAAPGAALPKGPGVLFPGRWPALKANGRWNSDLAGSRLHRDAIVTVDYLGRVAGRPKYDLAIVTGPPRLQTLLDRQGLPKGWYGSLLDSKGLIIARNVDPAHTVGRSASAKMKQHISQSPRGVFESRSLDGHRTLVAYNRSDVTGWVLSVAMPRGEWLGYANETLLTTLAAALVLLIAGTVIALILATGASRAIGRLETAATALGRGDQPSIPPAGILEIDAVAAALSRSAHDLRAREAELRDLNETLETRVKEATESLIQAQKLEAMGRLTGGVAHDFNNLLTAVIGNLSLLSRRLTDPTLARYAANATEAAEKGAKLTAQLLAFARKQRLTPEPVDVNAVVSGMSELVAGAVGRGVSVELELSPQAGLALADVTQLELIILNLAINARDAMADSGRLTIETGRRTLSVPARAPEDPAPGDYVMIAVADTGEGMTDDVRSQVFEPFFTTKDVGRGSGLGMSQILGVAKQLGGGVGIETALDHGSTVRIYLPVALAPAPIAPPTSAAPVALGLLGLTVLLVDDDAAVRDITAGLLSEAGMVALPAAAGQEALDLLQGGAKPDLALVDFAMPGLNGAETAARIVRTHPHLPILLMSGYMDTGAMGERWSGPVIAKPFTAQSLTNALAQALSAGQQPATA